MGSGQNQGFTVMEFLLVPLALIGIYALFKRNTQRGLNTVRAHIFLFEIAIGTTAHEANGRALAFNPDNLNPTIIRAARERVERGYEGSQLAMIAAAKALGFVPL